MYECWQGEDDLDTGLHVYIYIYVYIFVCEGSEQGVRRPVYMYLCTGMHVCMSARREKTTWTLACMHIYTYTCTCLCVEGRNKVSGDI